MSSTTMLSSPRDLDRIWRRGERDVMAMYLKGRRSMDLGGNDMFERLNCVEGRGEAERAAYMSRGLNDLSGSMWNRDRYNFYSSISSIGHTDVPEPPASANMTKTMS
jgi:hypothetical protein